MAGPLSKEFFFAAFLGQESIFNREIIYDYDLAPHLTFYDILEIFIQIEYLMLEKFKIISLD